jgi:hypothetical protein
MPKPKKIGFSGRWAKSPRAGEDLLRHLSSVVVRLESGEEVLFNLDDELAIPHDPEAIMDEAERAPAKTAFWAYQMERALREVRDRENDLEILEGEKYVSVRDHLMTHPDWRVVKPTDALIRSVLAQQDSVGDLREKLSALRESYGILRAVKDACEHRCFLLRKLIAQDQQAKFGQ